MEEHEALISRDFSVFSISTDLDSANDAASGFIREQTIGNKDGSRAVAFLPIRVLQIQQWRVQTNPGNITELPHFGITRWSSNASPENTVLSRIRPKILTGYVDDTFVANTPQHNHNVQRHQIYYGVGRWKAGISWCVSKKSINDALETLNREPTHTN